MVRKQVSNVVWLDRSDFYHPNNRVAVTISAKWLYVSAVFLVAMHLLGNVDLAQAQSSHYEQSKVEQGQLQPNTAAQIAALIREKATRTAVKRKIDAKLLIVSKMGYGLLGLPALRNSVVSPNGLVAMNISTRVTQRVRSTIAGVGGTVISASPRFNTILALVPMARAENIAALSDVHSMRLSAFNSGQVSTPPSSAIKRTLPANVNSEADAVHRAAEARQTFA
jgi:hypothetical protein